MSDGVGLLALAHVGEMVLVALREGGHRSLERGFAEEVVGLEGHGTSLRRERRACVAAAHHRPALAPCGDAARTANHPARVMPGAP